ncbi:alpha-xylosidase [Rathayibacter soli]|uniref:alpha-xylosidase n=1 Tax=Rathayibacter soli TaxID=3144168 RepID=UPI0027E4738F|nr:alpha-xylosidase [Glaciibacter superstes]
MKFTDGFWQLRPGVRASYASEAYDLDSDGESLTLTAPTVVVRSRGDVLNHASLTVTIDSPMDGVIGVHVEHFAGSRRQTGFELVGQEPHVATVEVGPERGTVTSGELIATVTRGAPWRLEFSSRGRALTASGHKSLAHVALADDALVASNAWVADEGIPVTSPAYMLAQLELAVGETVYGLGERFGPFVKNGQSIDSWNADGGTSSEQAYKNVPFYLTNRGYGVLVDHSGHVSFEVASEAVERVQFSVPGERLSFYVIDGPTPKEVLERYTRLTGRPATVPAWSYGLWLSTSFTTSYDEQTVSSFIDAMAERDLPLSVFHFDCFWMREFNWCDFEWDPRVFPDPARMLARLHEKGVRVCVWINPYIAQRSPLFAEGAERGYLLKRPNGDVWQWDLWQPGMGLVDFTNPDATAWFQGKLRVLVDGGVDAFKTDFGERVPLDVRFADGSSPERMHNLYAQLYNKAVHDVLVDARGEDDAVLFARSATTGGQSMPVHWGGDSTSTFQSMAETLRGGLSLAMSGFAFWSHDIGGFEGTPSPDVFKRWVAFGLLSSHSRLHGSSSYRVPWSFDRDPVTGELDESSTSAVAVTKRFAKLKNRLMPYLFAAGAEASERGTPVMRPMALEFPDDPAVDYLDQQYMLGRDILVAPVFESTGVVKFYLPAGGWTSLLTGERVVGGLWRTEQHDLDSLPLYVRDGAVLPIGSRDDRPDYDYLDGLTVRLYPGAAPNTIWVTSTDGSRTEVRLERNPNGGYTADVAGRSVRVESV